MTADHRLVHQPDGGRGSAEQSDDGRSVADGYLVAAARRGNERREVNRAFYVLKSRGMAHSNQVREFLLTDHGVELLDVYLGPNGALMGSARLAQEASLAVEAEARKQEIERQRTALERKRKLIGNQIDALQAELTNEEFEFHKAVANMQYADRETVQALVAIARLRQADE